LEVVSRDVGLTSKLIYDVVMHTVPGALLTCRRSCNVDRWWSPGTRFDGDILPTMENG